MNGRQPSQIRYRIAAEGEDWAAIRALVAESFAYMEGRIDPPSSLHRWSAEDAARHPGPVFLASTNGGVVGCAFGRVEGDALYLGKIATAPAFRGRGVARGLIGVASWQAARSGLKGLRLQSRIELNETHRAFARLGFVKTGETAHEGFDRPTSIDMAAPLTPAAPFAAPGDLAALEAIIRACPPLMAALRAVREIGLNDWWIVSGAIYNQVWNARTGRPDLYGVKDIDVFYFDPDTSWAAEDAVIRRAPAIDGAPPLEIRNQARVPLWYKDKFGLDYPPVSQSSEAILRFACLTHCVGARLEADDRLTLYLPYCAEAIFGFRLVPNLAMANRRTHEEKAERQSKLWPELTVVPWPDGK